MGATAGRKALMIMQNVKRVLAIELLCSAQGLDFRMFDDTVRSGSCQHALLLPGPGVLAAYKAIRARVPVLEYDREIHLDLQTAEQMVESGEIVSAVEAAIGSLS